MSPRVEVLLATYQGSRYLDAQVESILEQRGVETTILARDDGSTDETAQLLASYEKRWPSRFRVMPAGGRLGAALAFGALLGAADDGPVMISDQDDVWLPDKAARTLGVLAALESSHGSHVPLLVHTNLAVVDAELRPVAASFWSRQKLDVRTDGDLPRLLVRNVVTGSTIACNAVLRRVAVPVPPQAYMHDWWLALVACAFGRIGRLPEATVLYRQHGANAIGSEPAGPELALKRLGDLERVRRYYARSRDQARVLLARYGARIPPASARAVETWATLPSRSAAVRPALLLRHRVLDTGLLRNLALMLFGAGAEGPGTLSAGAGTHPASG